MWPGGENVLLHNAQKEGEILKKYLENVYIIRKTSIYITIIESKIYASFYPHEEGFKRLILE